MRAVKAALVVGFVGGFDLREHDAGFVGHDLAGYVDEVVLVGFGGAQGGGDLEEFGEGGLEGGEGGSARRREPRCRRAWW